MLKLDQYIETAKKREIEKRKIEVPFEQKKEYILKKLLNSGVMCIEFKVPYILWGFTLWQSTRRCEIITRYSFWFQKYSTTLSMWTLLSTEEDKELINFLTSDVPVGELEAIVV